jgi:hypothetical protein
LAGLLAHSILGYPSRSLQNSGESITQKLLPEYTAARSAQDSHLIPFSSPLPKKAWKRGYQNFDGKDKIFFSIGKWGVMWLNLFFEAL